MHWAEILHQLLLKAWWNFKPSRRFSRSLVMILWAKVRPGSGITASNIVASQVGHPQAKMRDQSRSKESVHSLLMEYLCMWTMSEQQKQLCMEIAQDMLDSANHNPDFMKTIITGDLIWVYGYDLETGHLAGKWKSDAHGITGGKEFCPCAISWDKIKSDTFLMHLINAKGKILSSLFS